MFIEYDRFTINLQPGDTFYTHALFDAFLPDDVNADPSGADCKFLATFIDNLMDINPSRAYFCLTPIWDQFKGSRKVV